MSVLLICLSEEHCIEPGFAEIATIGVRLFWDGGLSEDSHETSKQR
jgi:hypothetical protein